MHPVILFDGVCNLCSRSVQFVLKRDKTGKFRFASLQSDAARNLLEQANGQSIASGSIGHDTIAPASASAARRHFNSFILLDNGKIYTRSMASLRVMKLLGGGWSLLYIFRFVPAFIRNAIYDWIARNRYRWFGRREECWMPQPKWKERFLD